jgi:hypothetical protein
LAATKMDRSVTPDRLNGEVALGIVTGRQTTCGLLTPTTRVGTFAGENSGCSPDLPEGRTPC